MLIKRFNQTSLPILCFVVVAALSLLPSHAGAYFIFIVHAVLVATVAIVLLQGFSKVNSLPKSGIFSMLMLWWFFQAFSFFYVDSLAVGFQAFCIFSLMPLSFLFYTLLQDKPLFWRRFLICLTVFSLLSSAYAIIHHLQSVMLFQKQERLFFVNVNMHAALINLIVLPLITSYIAYFQKREQISKWRFFSFGLVLFILMLASNLAGSRAATICLYSAILMMIVCLRKHVKTNLLIVVCILSIAAIVTSSYMSSNYLIERTVSDIKVKHPNPRTLLWSSSLDLIKHAPWYGVGVGGFSVRYPEYSVGEDLSSKLYAHNDYLQSWVELGYPGLLTMCALMTSITYYFILFLKRCPSLSQRIEVTGLFCALYAIGLHGFGSYPFNVLSILILFGVFLARFHEQSVDGLVDHITIVPSKYCSRFMFNVLVILLASILLWKNILTQASHYYFFRGRHAFLTGDFSSAEHDFNIASAFQNSESVERTRGILMTTILQTLVDNTSEQAKQVFEYATSDFQHAIAYNPYDAKTRYLMGKLYVSYPALAGDDYAGIAAAQFKLGMQVDPGNFLNFYEYGKLLVSENKSLAALRVLEKGTQYAFPLDDRADDYFALLAKLKRDNKDTTRVKLWAQRRIPPGG